MLLDVRLITTYVHGKIYLPSPQGATILIKCNSEHSYLDGLYQRGISQTYARDAYDFHERDLDDLHIRDVFNLYSRGVDGFYGKGNKFHARDEECLNRHHRQKLGRRNEAPPSRPISPSPAAISSPHRPSSPISPGSASLSSSRGPSRPLSRQSNVDSVEYNPSEGSTESAVNVGMTRFKTSKEKSVKLVGLDGCHGIFLIGHDRTGRSFITGTHTERLHCRSVIFQAAQQAKAEGTVTKIIIYAPHDVGDIYQTHVNEFMKAQLMEHFPSIHPTEKHYRSEPGTGYWVFVATQGPPLHIEAHFEPIEGVTPFNTPLGSPRHYP